VKEESHDLFHVFQARRVSLKAILGFGLEEACIATDGHHFFNWEGRRVHHGGSENRPSARRASDKISLFYTDGFKETPEVLDPEARGIREGIYLIGLPEAQHVRGDHVEISPQRLHVEPPGGFRRSSVFAPVEQYEIGSLSSLQVVGFDVPHSQSLMTIRLHGFFLIRAFLPRTLADPDAHFKIAKGASGGTKLTS